MTTLVWSRVFEFGKGMLEGQKSVFYSFSEISSEV